MSLRDILFASTVILIWGLNFIAMKIGVAEAPPFLLAALRFFMAAFPFIFFFKKPDVPWRIIIAHGLSMGAIQFGFLFYALHAGMPAGLASLVMQMQAFFTVLVAFLFLKEIPRLTQIMGILLAFGGITVIALDKAEAVPIMPLFCVLGAAFSWAISNIIAKKAGQVDMLSFTVWVSLVPPLPLMALSYIVEGPEKMISAFISPSWAFIASLAFSAYGSTLIGYVLWGDLLRRHPVSKIAPLTLLVPVVGISSTALVFGEPFHGTILIGGLLIFAGLIINIFGKAMLGLFRPAP